MRKNKTVRRYDRGKGGKTHRIVLSIKRPSHVDAREVYTPLSEFAKMGVMADPSERQKKDVMFYADWSIVGHIDKINAMGFDTLASCSSMRKDHNKDHSSHKPDSELDSYVTILLPKSVASYEDGKIKDWDYLDKLATASNSAGWEFQLFNKNVNVAEQSFPSVKLYISKKRSEMPDEKIVREWDNLVKELRKIKL